jgi:hypothetical protein
MLSDMQKTVPMKKEIEVDIVFAGRPRTATFAGELSQVEIEFARGKRRSLRVWLRNLRCIPVRIALAVLRRAFRRDPGFYDSWHANIAMPIYDATRPMCTCDFSDGHEPQCPKAIAQRTRNFHPMSLELANEIGDRLMRHLFDV